MQHSVKLDISVCLCYTHTLSGWCRKIAGGTGTGNDTTGQQTLARLPLPLREPQEPETVPLSAGSVQGPTVPPEQNREYFRLKYINLSLKKNNIQASQTAFFTAKLHHYTLLLRWLSAVQLSFLFFFFNKQEKMVQN